MLQHIADFLANQRRLHHAAVVSVGSEQPKEAAFTDGAAALVIAEHADVIHVAHAVDPRTGVGLGDDHRLAMTPGSHRLRQRAQGARLHLGAILPQDAQTSAFHDAQLVAFANSRHFVVTHAKEGEMIVNHPLEEFLALGDQFLVGPGGPLRQFADGFLRHRRHFLPVGHGDAHLVHRVLDLAGDAAQYRFIGLAIDLELHHRLIDAARIILLADLGELAGRPATHPDDRVNDQVNTQFQLGQRQVGAVDQERHVIVDHLDNGVFTLPAIVFLGGVKNPQQQLPGLAHAQEIELVLHHPGQHIGRVATDVLQGNAAKIGRHVASCKI